MMKSKVLILLLVAFTVSSNAITLQSCQGQSDPWTPQQLMPPADLAKALNNPEAAKPLIFSIGMQAIIKNSIDIGPAMAYENLQALKQKLEKLDKNTSIVVYCGCCPFSNCPNVRPAMELLKNMQFTNISPTETIRVITSNKFEVVNGDPKFDTKYDTIPAQASAEEWIRHTYRDGWEQI